MAYILLVEHDGNSGEVVARFLGRLGHRVAVVADGQDALVKLVDDLPDVVVLDVRLPRVERIGLAEVIRWYLGWNHLPVIILSADVSPQQMTRARDLGVRLIFRKGQFAWRDLGAAIDEVTNGRPSG